VVNINTAQGFGALNKVALEFEHVFWQDEYDYTGQLRGVDEQRGRFYIMWSLSRVNGSKVQTLQSFGLQVGGTKMSVATKPTFGANIILYKYTIIRSLKPIWFSQLQPLCKCTALPFGAGRWLWQRMAVQLGSAVIEK
jgi:hypothetical protein